MLWVTPDGGKYWQFAYRFPGLKDGKPKLLQKSLAFGPYSQVGLAEARAARDAAAKLLGQVSIHPNTSARHGSRRPRRRGTPSPWSRPVLNKKRREGKAPATMAKVEWLIGLAMPALGGRPIAEITAVEVLAVLRQVDQRGRYETAVRLRSTLSEVFRLAVATARCPRRSDGRAARPADRAQGSTPRGDYRAQGLWRPAPRHRWLGWQHSETRLAMQLLSLTFVRPGELRSARWEEFDLDASVWMIPASKMKMRREHRVPLSRQAVEIVRELRTLARRPYLFAGGRTPTRCMSEDA